MVQIKNENANKFEIGDEVWWFDAWGNLRNGKIHARIDKERVLVKTIGTEGVKLCHCWPNKDACLNAERRREKAQKAEYIESVKDVNDLVIFLFEHNVVGEDHDYDAEYAARKIAKELLGIDFD